VNFARGSLVLFSLTAILQFIEFKGANDPFYYYLSSGLLLQSMGFNAGATHIFADSTIGIAWTISCELWIGIMIFPVVYHLRQSKAVLSIMAIVFAYLSMALIVQYSPDYHLNANFQRIGGPLTVAMLRCIVGYCLGIFAFVIYQKVERSDIGFIITIGEITTILLCIALYAHFNYDQRNEFVAPFLFAITIICFALHRGFIGKILGIKQLKPVYHLSYAIYLVHPIFIHIYRKMSIAFDVEHSIYYLLLVIVSAEVLYQFVEKPSTQLAERLLAKRIKNNYHTNSIQYDFYT
jgi:peptidoglycan/LPS O-acetylase OafA/YrhL